LAQAVLRATRMNLQRLPLLLVSVLLAACGTVVVEGGGDNAKGNGNAGGGGSGQGTSTGGSGNSSFIPAVALTRAQNDILWDEYWAENDPSGGTSSAGGGGDLNPDDLFLHLSDLGVSCGSPTVELACGGHYQLTLVLPPALQQVGVYDLEDPQILQYSGMSETGEMNSPNPGDCPWGGGSLGSGTIEIFSIDDTEVRFELNLADGIWDADPSAQYIAPRCP
jgi:hypothetical protein